MWTHVPADGHTSLQVAHAHTVNMNLYRALAYDMLRDSAPVSKMDIAPMTVVAHPPLPVKSMRELTQLASKSGAKSSSKRASAPNKVFEVFKKQFKIKYLRK